MKIYNNTNITYSAIEHNSRKNTKQNFSADLEKKMTQYTDTLSISKTGQEIFKHLSSVSFMDYVFFLSYFLQAFPFLMRCLENNKRLQEVKMLVATVQEIL